MFRSRRRTLVVSIECDDQSGNTVHWVNGISGEYVDREEALNARPCYLREDGARLYWDDGQTNSRGWWVHDKEFAVYAYRDGEDKDVPADEWQCPGALYMYVSIDLRVSVKETRSRSRVRAEHSCTQGVCGFFGQLRDRCCNQTAAPVVKTRGVVAVPSSPADAAAGPGTSPAPESSGRMGKGLSLGIDRAKTLHSEHWPTVRQKASDGFGKAKESGQHASVSCQAFVNDPENQEWAKSNVAAGKHCCTICVGALADIVADCCQGNEEAEAKAGKPGGPKALLCKEAEDQGAEMAAGLDAGKGLGISAEPSPTNVAKSGGADELAVAARSAWDFPDGGDASGGSTDPDPLGPKKAAFTENERVAIGVGLPYGIGIACHNGSDGSVPNSDAAVAMSSPGEDQDGALL